MAGSTWYIGRNRYLEPVAHVDRLGENVRPLDPNINVEMPDASAGDFGPGDASAAGEPAPQPATQQEPPAEEQARPPRIVRRVLREIDRSGCLLQLLLLHLA